MEEEKYEERHTGAGLVPPLVPSTQFRFWTLWRGFGLLGIPIERC